MTKQFSDKFSINQQNVRSIKNQQLLDNTKFPFGAPVRNSDNFNELLIYERNRTGK